MWRPQAFQVGTSGHLCLKEINALRRSGPYLVADFLCTLSREALALPCGRRWHHPFEPHVGDKVSVVVVRVRGVKDESLSPHIHTA